MASFKSNTREKLKEEYSDNESLIEGVLQLVAPSERPKVELVFDKLLRRAEALGRNGHELTVRFDKD
jgi:hypothetical protein